jgi:hypothetical protein
MSTLRDLADQSKSAVLDTARQQTAAILAIGAANDAQRRQMAQPTAPAINPSRTVTSVGSISQPTGTVAHPMFVAFSFSKLGLSDFGGDGAWGAAVDQNEQAAMDQSGNICAANSQRPNWCGVANGGRYPVCRADGKTQWVALAINNDGTLENWANGEAVGYDTEYGAEQAAVGNCNHSGCHVVWSAPVDCAGGGGSVRTGGAGVVAHPPDKCTYATQYVTGTAKVGSDGFIVGNLTNNSNQTLYVSYTFARGGKPAKDTAGGVTIRPGQTVGGEGGGIWEAADSVDTNPPKIFWYAVLQSDVDAGKSCGSAW